VLLLQTAEREVTALPFFFVFLPLFLLRFPFFLFLSICFSPPVPLPVSVSSLSLSSHSPSPLFQTSPSSFLPLSIVSFISFFFSSQFLLFLSSCAGVDSSIYRAKGSGGVLIAALSLCMGSRAFLPCHGAGLGGQWAWFAGTASLASNYERACILTKYVGRERGWKNYIGKKQKFHSSPAARLGEEGGTVLLKTKPFCSLSFFYMKRRRFGQNAPFQLNIAPTCQLPNQSLIYPLFIYVLKCNFDFKNQFNCIPTNFNRCPYS
jgi:hypothetical protein